MNEDLTDRFIEAATRPLAEDPPVRDEARGELMGRLEYAAKGRAREVEAATERMEQSATDRWGAKVITLSVLFLLLTALANYFAWNSLGEMKEFANPMGLQPAAFKPDTELTAEQRALKPYLGEEFMMGPWDVEELWKAYPDDPAVFALYSENYMDSHLKPPADYRATWQRLDPGNGTWPALEAIKKVETSLDLTARTVKDESAFTEALALLEEAAAAPAFKFRSREMERRYMELFQQPRTVLGEMRCLALTQTLLMAGSVQKNMQPLALAFSIQAERLETAKDEEGLRRLIQTWEKLAGGFLTNATNESDVSNAETVLRANSDLINAATAIGMIPEKERLEKQEAAIKEVGISSGPVGPSPGMGMLARLSMFSYQNTFEPAVFEPGRRAEYALLDQLTTYLAIGILLFVLLVVLIESVRRGKHLNGLASGLAPLFRWSDTLWIFGLGVVAPLAWYLGISWLMPLGCRDVGMIHFPTPPMLLQFLAAYLLVSVMLVQTIVWRITWRAGFLALGSRRLIVGWITALLPAAVIPLTGTVRWINGNQDDFLLAMFLACGIPALWLLWQGGATVFSPKAGALGGVLLVRKMAAPLVALLAFLTGMQPLLHATELKWLARDTVSRSDFSRGGVSKLQLAEVDRQVAGYLKALGRSQP